MIFTLLFNVAISIFNGAQIEAGASRKDDLTRKIVSPICGGECEEKFSELNPSFASVFESNSMSEFNDLINTLKNKV